MELKQKPMQIILPPKGTLVGILVQVRDLGTQPSGKFGSKPQIELCFETPDDTHIFKEDRGPEPFLIGQSFTMSLAETANLTAFLLGMLGELPTDSEGVPYVNFDDLIGTVWLINVVYSKPNAKKQVFANIVSASPLPAAMANNEYSVHNPMFCIDLSPDKFDQSLFDQLPLHKRKKIASSPEYKAVGAPVEEDGSTQQSAEDKELPFDETDNAVQEVEAVEADDPIPDPEPEPEPTPVRRATTVQPSRNVAATAAKAPVKAAAAPVKTAAKAAPAKVAPKAAPAKVAAKTPVKAGAKVAPKKAVGGNTKAKGLFK